MDNCIATRIKGVYQISDQSVNGKRVKFQLLNLTQANKRGELNKTVLKQYIPTDIIKYSPD